MWFRKDPDLNRQHLCASFLYYIIGYGQVNFNYSWTHGYDPDHPVFLVRCVVINFKQKNISCLVKGLSDDWESMGIAYLLQVLFPYK
jgi:hypothetical protein